MRRLINLINFTSGKQGAVLCNQVLKEETTEFLTDAKLLTAAVLG